MILLQSWHSVAVAARKAKHLKRAVECLLLARHDSSPSCGRVVGSNAPSFRAVQELGANLQCVATIVWTFGPLTGKRQQPISANQPSLCTLSR
jgi:hypothetical protein